MSSAAELDCGKAESKSTVPLLGYFPDNGFDFPMDFPLKPDAIEQMEREMRQAMTAVMARDLAKRLEADMKHSPSLIEAIDRAHRQHMLEQNCMLVCLDGNIGSGKSTLLDILRRRLKSPGGVHVVPEPVKEWLAVEDSKKQNLLGRFYNEGRDATLFQIVAFGTRLFKLHEMQEEYHSEKDTTAVLPRIWLTERSIHSDMHIFAQQAAEDGKIDELQIKWYEQIYKRWTCMFARKTRPDVFIYLRTSPETCDKRIATRGRPEEKGKIPLQYLKALHTRTETLMTKWKEAGMTILEIDGEPPYVHSEADIAALVARVQAVIDSEFEKQKQR